MFDMDAARRLAIAESGYDFDLEDMLYNYIMYLNGAKLSEFEPIKGELTEFTFGGRVWRGDINSGFHAEPTETVR